MMISRSTRALLTMTLAAACSGESADRGADSTPAAPSRPADPNWVARGTGIGTLGIGMRRNELIKVIGQPSRAGYYTHEPCTYMRGSALPQGVQIMVNDSTVARIDVMEPGVRTAEGAQVGDSEASVLKMYEGRVTVEPHKYSGPEWHYLIVTVPGDTAHRIIFETDGRTVRNYRVGRRPEVEWVEGCS